MVKGENKTMTKQQIKEWKYPYPYPYCERYKKLIIGGVEIDTEDIYNEKIPKYLKDATILDAVVEINNNKLHWIDGIWSDGVFPENGMWSGGHFLGGIWFDDQGWHNSATHRNWVEGLDWYGKRSKTYMGEIGPLGYKNRNKSYDSAMTDYIVKWEKVKSKRKEVELMKLTQKKWKE